MTLQLDFTRTERSSAVTTHAPRFTQTIPRQLVHRAAIAETFLTDWSRLGEHTFVLGAQWPRAHTFYQAVQQSHDPLLVAETIRQAGLLLSHAAYKVPLGYCFTIRELDYRVDPARLRTGSAPAEIELLTEGRDVQMRDDTLAGMSLAMSMHRGNVSVGNAHVSFKCMPSPVYERLRGRADHPIALPPSAPVTPASVARDRVQDVVLSPTQTVGEWRLRVDPSHPVLFDHPVDHVPGMLLMEAMRQAAILTNPGLPIPAGLKCAFYRFTELDQPCLISTRQRSHNPDGTVDIEITLRQSDQLVAEGAVTLTTT